VDLKKVKIEKVKKIEAAERQLDLAIRLFFKRADSISVHTLTCAAHKILCDIGKKAGIKNLRDDSWVRDDKKTEFHKIISGAENFFKHGSRSKDEEFQFRPEVTPYYIIDSVALISKLGHKCSNEQNCFSLWFHLKNPDLLNFDELKKNPSIAYGIEQLEKTDPDDFELFSMALEKMTPHKAKARH